MSNLHRGPTLVEPPTNPDPYTSGETKEGKDSSKPAPEEVRGKQSTVRQWVPAATTVGLILGYEILARMGLLGQHFPTSIEIGSALLFEFAHEKFWTRLFETLFAWVVGFVVATIIAIPMGFALAAVKVLYKSTRLVIEFLRPIPPVAVLPLAVLVLGTGTEMKIYLVIFAALWPILIQTIYGAHDLDPVAHDTVRAYGLKRSHQYRWVILPSAAPYIATGLRLSATIALIVTIATELIVGSNGLGFHLNEFRYASNTPGMYAMILVAGILGWLNAAFFRSIERRVLHWHHSQRGEA